MPNYDVVRPSSPTTHHIPLVELTRDDQDAPSTTTKTTTTTTTSSSSPSSSPSSSTTRSYSQECDGQRRDDLQYNVHAYALEYPDDSSFCEKVLTQFILTTLPSFLQPFLGGEPSKPAKLHDIAALDGLRGWACLLVFNFHFLFTYTWQVSIGWGFNGENFGLHQLPIFHLLISGHVMVAIFFIISGYVLSYRPLRMIRSRSWDQTLTVLASSTFRRALRLYIPSIVGTFLVFVGVRAGFYDYSHIVLNDGHTVTGTNEQHPPILKTFGAQFWDWYRTVVLLINPWDWNLYYNNYNPHLWTIPVEFRSSLVLFLTILGTSRMKPAMRMLVVSGLVVFCVRWGRWEMVLFLSGLLLAEVDQINGIWSHPVLGEKLNDPSFFARPNSRAFWITVLVVGLFIASSPNVGMKFTPGYMWLARLTPETYPEPHRFPQTIGAILIVCSINNSKTIQKLFTNQVSQYLGNISYAFYVVHGPILHSVGYSIMPSIWAVTGKQTNYQFCLGLLVGWLVCFPVSLWAGDVFWRMVDIPSVKFARWLESKIVVKTGDPPLLPRS
ncbi:Acyltransferase family domain containing protein [Elaphomyces granulatus]